MENSQPATPEVSTPVTETPVAEGKVETAKTPAPELSKKEEAIIRKYMIDGIEYDETTIKQKMSKGDGADKKFLEANKIKQEAIKFLKLAKTNPTELLSKLGQDPKKWAFDMVAKQVQDDMRDPKEVALEAAQKRLEEFERKEAEAKSAHEAERLEQETKAMEQKFHTEIIAALEAAPALPKNGFTVAKIAKYIDTVRNKTGQLLSAMDVVKVVERDTINEMKGVLSGADAQKIIALIGEEGMAAIRKYDIAQLKNPLKQDKNPQVEVQNKERKKGSSKDFWSSIKKDYKRERGEI